MVLRQLRHACLRCRLQLEHDDRSGECEHISALQRIVLGRGQSRERLQIQFLGSSQLTVDDYNSFGTGSAGPLLESFASGETADLKNFTPTPTPTLDFNTQTGLLTVSNGTKTADLSFQTSSLGSGTFHATGDLAGGLLITHYV